MRNLKIILSKSILLLFFSNFNFIGKIVFSDFENVNLFLNNGVLDESKDTFNKNKNSIDGIIVKYNSKKISQASFASFIDSNGLDLVDKISGKNISLLEINDENQSITKIINNLKKDGRFDYVEPNYIYGINSINSNDTYKNNLWGLENFGQNILGQTGTIGSDISFSKAIEIFSGGTNISSTGVIVAILDSGVAYNHPDLKNKMWDGVNCKDENGVFLGGCIHGYDFADNDKDPDGEIENHGTHIAGTIASEMNNGTGIIGVNPNGKIMTLRMGDSSFSSFSVIKSIYFAKENGAKIINASYGYDGGVYGVNQLEYQAVKSFTDSGGLFISAAGNDGNNNDSLTNRFFPASYGHDNYINNLGHLVGSNGSGVTVLTGITNLISVAATDNKDNLASFSNYGSNFVNISAPGVGIFSTIFGDINYFNYSFSGNLLDFETGGVNNNWGNNGGGLWGDLNNPYGTGSDSYIEKQIDLSLVKSPTIDFSVWCDAGKNLSGYDNYSTDFLTLSFSTGGLFTDYDKFNYTSSSLDLSTGGGFYGNLSIPLNSFKSPLFKFRFTWHSDNIQDTDRGCFIFNSLKINGKESGASGSYGYLQGTSMAAPHVSGLASYLWSYSPNSSALDIKNLILNNGDSIPSMSGKTTSGKRINIYKSLFPLLNNSVISNLSVYEDISKSNLLSSGKLSLLNSAYLEWSDDINPLVLSGYILELKTNTGFLLSTKTTKNKFFTGFTLPSNGYYNFSVYQEIINGKTGSLLSSDNILFTPIQLPPKVNAFNYGTGNLRFEVFNDLMGTGVLIYGTGNLDNYSTGYYNKSNVFDINAIEDDTTYYYKAFFINNGISSPYTQTGIIKTPKKISNLTLSGTSSFTGNLDLFESTNTGVKLFGTGNLRLFSEVGKSFIEIPKNSVDLISSSGYWDGIIESPHIKISTGTLSFSGFTRKNDLTFKIGSNKDSIIFSGGEVFVALDVGLINNGKLLKVFSSNDNQLTFNYLSDCNVKNGLCYFNTNQLGDFTLFESNSLDLTPDQFVFNSIIGADLSTSYLSNYVTITGMNTENIITVSNGSLFINGVNTGSSGFVNSGSLVSINLLSSSIYNTLVSSIISVGGVTGNFSITTKQVSSGGGGSSGGSSGGGGGSSSVGSTSQPILTNTGIITTSSGLKITSTGVNLISTGVVLLDTGMLLKPLLIEEKNILDYKKQLIISKNILNKTKEGKNFIKSFDKSIQNFTKDDLERYLINLPKIKNKKLSQDYIDYIESKVNVSIDLIIKEEVKISLYKKQLIISKADLNKSNKGKKMINDFDKKISKMNKKTLEKFIDTFSNMDKKGLNKSYIDYIESKSYLYLKSIIK